MLEFKADAFYEATTAIRHLVSTIDAKQITSVQKHEDGSVTLTALTDLVLIRTLRGNCEKLRESSAVLGTAVTAIAVDDLDRSLAPNSGSVFPTYDSIRSAIYEIQATLRRELTLVTLLALQPSEREYFEPKEPLFGTGFETKFPSGLFELEEAAKCFALSRYTASAFHLLRLIEIGLNAVSVCLSVQLPSGGAARNWGIVNKAVKDEIDARTKAKRWNGSDREFFESVHASLNAIRVAWRNPTMHVETKYVRDEAEHIFFVVKGFMKKLASQMDESGLPLA